MSSVQVRQSSGISRLVVIRWSHFAGNSILSATGIVAAVATEAVGVTLFFLGLWVIGGSGCGSGRCLGSGESKGSRFTVVKDINFG